MSALSEPSAISVDISIEEPVQELQDDSLPTVYIRSIRTKQTPTWTKAFVSLNINKEVQYPMSNYMSYAHLSPTYQCYIATTSTVKEPTTYSEAIKYKRWVDTMQAEIQALESNKTFESH